MRSVSIVKLDVFGVAGLRARGLQRNLALEVPYVFSQGVDAV